MNTGVPMSSHRVRVSLLRENSLDVLFAEEDVDYLLPAMLERGVIDVNVGREEELGVPGKALARGQVRDLVTMCESSHAEGSKIEGGLTSRGGPSGSWAMLIVVHSC